MLEYAWKFLCSFHLAVCFFSFFCGFWFLISTCHMLFVLLSDKLLFAVHFLSRRILDGSSILRTWNLEKKKQRRITASKQSFICKNLNNLKRNFQRERERNFLFLRTYNSNEWFLWHHQCNGYISSLSLISLTFALLSPFWTIFNSDLLTDKHSLKRFTSKMSFSFLGFAKFAKIKDQEWNSNNYLAYNLLQHTFYSSRVI